MKNEDITDQVFREAVTAISLGDVDALGLLLDGHPDLLTKKLITGENGYFKDPYLLYFVADNPIRNGRLPKNIVEVTQLLVKRLNSAMTGSLQEQLDYALGLVATGRIAKECAVQMEMIDLLIDEGASPGDGLAALAHGNPEAALHLIYRGAELRLPVAVGLNMVTETSTLLKTANEEEKITALAVAAFSGNAEMVSRLLLMGMQPDTYPSGNGFHTHATALHQAVYSGSIETVKVLIDAGANLLMKDKIYGGTPVEWAKHMQTSHDGDNNADTKFKAIETYLADRLSQK